MLVVALHEPAGGRDCVFVPSQVQGEQLMQASSDLIVCECRKRKSCLMQEAQEVPLR
jgi:hypothetical protein